MLFREEVSDKPGRKTRQDQQREDLRHDHTEGHPEIYFCYRVHQRNNQWHQHSSENVYKNDIGGDTRDITAKFAGDNGCCCSCRTDEAEHGTFYKHHPVSTFHRKHGNKQISNYTQKGEKSSLNKKKPPMPSMRFEILRLNTAEGQEQHREDEHRLQKPYHIGKERSEAMKARGCVVYKKNGCSRRHSDRKHPFPYCFDQVQFRK